MIEHESHKQFCKERNLIFVKLHLLKDTLVTDFYYDLYNYNF